MATGLRSKPRTAVVNTARISRDEWLEYRRTGIGGSDAATIVGLNPYLSLYYLYCDKRGELPPKEPTEAMRLGTDLEQYVADRWAECTGKTVRKDRHMWRSTRWPWMLADVDRVVVGENAGLECKTTSPFNKHDFAGGEIPLTYYVQCQHYMAVMGFDRMYLAVLVLGQGFYHFTIDRDEQEIEALAQAEGDFWEMVQTGTPPPVDAADATTAALQHQYPAETPGEWIPLPDGASELLDRLCQTQQLIKELDSDCTAAKNQVKAWLGNAEGGTCAGYICTWKSTARGRVLKIKQEKEKE